MNNISFTQAREIKVGDCIADRDGVLFTVTAVEFKDDLVHITVHSDFVMLQPRPAAFEPYMTVRRFNYHIAGQPLPV